MLFFFGGIRCFLIDFVGIDFHVKLKLMPLLSIICIHKMINRLCCRDHLEIKIGFKYVGAELAATVSFFTEMISISEKPDY